MKNRKRIVFIVIGALAAGISVRAEQGRGRGRISGKHARNIIFMVPDGMGLADVTAARIFKGGPDGTLSKAGDIDQGGWTSSSHTAVDTIVWSGGCRQPVSRRCPG